MRPRSRSIALLSLLIYPIQALAQPSEAQPPGGAPPDAPAEPEPAPEEKAPEESAPPEAPANDEEAVPEGENPARPPAKGKGVVWGVITDTKLEEPLAEASVKVLDTTVEAVADFDGRYRLELPPGTYTLRFFYELHRPTRLDRVVVEEGRVVKVDAELEPEAEALDTIEVETEANRSTIEGEILSRQRSAAVGDSVGRVEIAKSPDRNAAQAAQRVVGATIVGNRFVYVRGLGERYTNAQLNGVPLPSPEPDRAAVPLDLFPTAVLNNLTIAKTFTPDKPGDFAGGSVRIETREIPGSFMFQGSLSGGFNTNTTFRDRLNYPGGSLDWLGLDDGTRRLPDVPDYKLAVGSDKPDGTRVTAEELVESGRKLNSPVSKHTSGTPIDHGAAVVVGNGWQLDGEQKIGVIAAVNYGRSYMVRRDEVRNQFEGDVNDPRGISEARRYTVTTGADNVSWGGFASLSYRMTQNHKLSLIGIRTTLSDDQTLFIEGFHKGRSAFLRANRLQFVTRALNVGQLSGEHAFPDLGGAALDWNLTLSNATRYQPDTRDLVYGRSENATAPGYRYTDGIDAGRHFFSDQYETQYGAGLDWTQPIIPRSDALKLKFGGLASLRDRNFWSRKLPFRRQGPPNNSLFACDDGDIDRCAAALFQDENVGTVVGIRESTAPSDTYDATLNIFAGYLMADAALASDLRLIVGQRVEHTFQEIEPYDQFDIETPPAGATVDQTDLLPAAALVWSLTDSSKLRAAATRTLARPQLRELAPFAFSDFFGGRVTSGNPDLELTRITNLDLRFEHFPTLREVLAFSVFYKDFEDPIEPVIEAQGDDGLLTYRNALGAQLIGVELEARKNLAFAAPALKDFDIVTNLTVAQSKIEIADDAVLDLTSLSRPLVNQAPYVFNFALDYTRDDVGFTARLLYNLVGPRIAEVGVDPLPDVYEHQRSLLDFTLQQEFLDHFQLKFAARNLLNSEILLTHGCGSSGVFSSTWHLACEEESGRTVRRYTEGVSFALTATYNH